MIDRYSLIIADQGPQLAYDPEGRWIEFSQIAALEAELKATKRRMWEAGQAADAAEVLAETAQRCTKQIEEALCGLADRAWTQHDIGVRVHEIMRAVFGPVAAGASPPELTDGLR